MRKKGLTDCDASRTGFKSLVCSQRTSQTFERKCQSYRTKFATVQSVRVTEQGRTSSWRMKTWFDGEILSEIVLEVARKRSQHLETRRELVNERLISLRKERKVSHAVRFEVKCR